MRATRFLNLPAVARALGFVVVAIAILATALHFSTQPRRAEPRAADAPATADPLAEELLRCQLIADQAKDDAACEAAWAESRRRFFTYPSASAPTADPAANTKR
jgi:conjugative transfer region protein TrbK